MSAQLAAAISAFDGSLKTLSGSNTLTIGDLAVIGRYYGKAMRTSIGRCIRRSALPRRVRSAFRIWRRSLTGIAGIPAVTEPIHYLALGSSIGRRRFARLPPDPFGEEVGE